MVRRSDNVACVERSGPAWPAVASRLPAFYAAQTPGEIMDAGRWHIWQRAKVNAARRPAARALDFQPCITTVNRLVDGGRRVDRTAVGPHPLIPALAGKIVCLADQCFTRGALLERALGQNARHSTHLGQLLRERLAVAARQRRGVYFGAMIRPSKRGVPI
jgi:hypothetical protein